MPTKARAKSRGKRNKSATPSDDQTPPPEEVEPPPTPPEPYFGPRPDEELLFAVNQEISYAPRPVDLERIYKMIQDDDEDINQCFEDRRTPLSVAAGSGNCPLVSLLLEKKADPFLASIDTSELPLHHAARRGHRVACELLLEFCKPAIDDKSAAGWTALHLSAAGGHPEATRVLLRHGAQPNSANMLHGGETPMHFAGRVGNVDLMESLIDFEAELDPIDGIGRAPLHHVVMGAKHKCLSLLLRSKSDPQRVGPNGMRPLDLLRRDQPDGERCATLLGAYIRDPPKPKRTDLRFDLDEDPLF